jgi:hypothetical protein
VKALHPLWDVGTRLPDNTALSPDDLNLQEPRCENLTSLQLCLLAEPQEPSSEVFTAVKLNRTVFWSLKDHGLHHIDSGNLPYYTKYPTNALLHYRPGQALTVPGCSGSQDLETIGTWRWQVCQSHAPTAFSPRRYPWCSFLLEAESTPRHSGLQPEPQPTAPPHTPLYNYQ